MKNLSKVLSEELTKQGLAATHWAVSAGIDRTIPTSLKDGRRPAEDTLYKIVHGWDNPISGIRCAQAHLLDELERMGLTSDQISITVRGDEMPDVELEESLRILNDYIRSAPNLRVALKKLAHTISETEDDASDEEIISGAEKLLKRKTITKSA